MIVHVKRHWHETFESAAAYLAESNPIEAILLIHVQHSICDGYTTQLDTGQLGPWFHVQQAVVVETLDDAGIIWSLVSSIVECVKEHIFVTVSDAKEMLTQFEVKYRWKYLYAEVRWYKYEVISKTPVRHVERSRASIAVLVVCANVSVVTMVPWSCYVGQDFWILPRTIAENNHVSNLVLVPSQMSNRLTRCGFFSSGYTPTFRPADFAMSRNSASVTMGNL